MHLPLVAKLRLIHFLVPIKPFLLVVVLVKLFLKHFFATTSHHEFFLLQREVVLLPNPLHLDQCLMPGSLQNQTGTVLALLLNSLFPENVHANCLVDKNSLGT